MNTIERHFASDLLDVIKEKVDKGEPFPYEHAKRFIEKLPSAQPESNYDEWCTDCKEYDKEKHSCPRWNKVIRNTVDELKSAQPELCEDAVSRNLVLSEVKSGLIRTIDGDAWKRVNENVIGIKSLPPVTPKQRTGKCRWCERLKERNLRIEYYWIDEEGCTASFSEPHIVATGIANYCPNCGAKMEGGAE